jgi:hypothetical protein
MSPTDYELLEHIAKQGYLKVKGSNYMQGAAIPLSVVKMILWESTDDGRTQRQSVFD